MIEFIEDTPNQKCVCKTDKLNTDIIIQKSNNGFVFFEIKFTKGSPPAELSGNYTNILKAKQAVEKYVRNRKETPTVRRDNFSKARQERKKQDGAEIKSKGSEHVHQGSDNGSW